MQNHNSQLSTTTSSSFRTTTGTTIPAPYILLATALFSLILIICFSTSSTPPPPPLPHPSLFPSHNPHRLLFLGSSPSDPNRRTAPSPPSIAYLIFGSFNDTGRILRLLYSIYHPRNAYLLHLDSNAPQSERDALARTVHSVPLFKAAQNVNVVGKGDVVYIKGSSSLSSTLHGASILFHISRNWDWFINLSVDDYPLVTQDGIFYISI